MGLFKTINMIAANPFRSRTWKILDITVLCVLWIATVVSILIWLDGHSWSGWSVAVRILVLVTLAATARSWYRSPTASKRARQRSAELRRTRTPPAPPAPGPTPGWTDDPPWTLPGPDPS